MSDPTPPTPPPDPKRAKVGSAFWVVLMVPAVLATMAPALHPDYLAGMSLGCFAAFAGIPAGIVCGVMLGRNRGEDGARIVLLCVGLILLSTGLAFGGCVAAVAIQQ